MPVDDAALTRFRLLQPVLEDGVALCAVSRASGVPEPTLRRWLARYCRQGLAGLQRQPRSAHGRRRRVSAELVAIIEGLALQRPPQSAKPGHVRAGTGPLDGEVPATRLTFYQCAAQQTPDALSAVGGMFSAYCFPGLCTGLAQFLRHRDAEIVVRLNRRAWYEIVCRILLPLALRAQCYSVLSESVDDGEILFVHYSQCCA